MASTFLKVDAIKDAYSQLRISGLTVNPTPEDLELALDRLEGMAAEWDERNICANYNFEDEPDPNSDSGVKRGFKQAFASNLAVRLIPDFNKQVPATLLLQARQSLSNLSGRSAYSRVSGVAYPSRQPVGSGNTLRFNRWQRFYSGAQPAPNSCDTNCLYVGDVNDYTETYNAWLNLDDNEIIDSFSIVPDSGITIESSSNTDTEVLYRVKAGSESVTQATIVVETDAGRRTTRVVYFEVLEAKN